MKRLLSIAVFCIICISTFAQNPKYVFYFIGDGMGMNHVYGTQLFNAAAKGLTAPEPLTFTEFPHRGFITTYCTTTLVTDSAAAGTALATGEKTYYGSIGMDVNHKPLTSIARKIKDAGFGTGVVTSVGVNHATPAAFYGNVENRNSYSEIFMQLLEGRVDFAAGGDILVTSKSGDTPEDLCDKARKAGWKVYLGDECKGAKGAKDKTLLIGREFGHEELKYAIDNDGVTLADLTKAAIDNMTRYHKDGFFLMIEGGMIDHAAHADDVASTFHEVNDMDRAIDLALEFYRQHPDETLILVTADHETGGLGLGAGKYELNMPVLLHQKVSKTVLNEQILALVGTDKLTWDNVKKVISDGTGLFAEIKVPEKQEAAFKATFERTLLGDDKTVDAGWYYTSQMLTKEVIDYLDRQAGMYYIHTAHSAAQVPVYSIGAGAEKIAACRDNTEIPQAVLELMLK